MRPIRRAPLVALMIIAACGRTGPASERRDETDALASDKSAAGDPGAAGLIRSRELQPAMSPVVTGQGVTNALEGRAPNVQIQTQVSGSALLPETIAPSMIIRAGTASIEVDSLAVGIASVRRLAARVGGFVANASIEAGQHQGKSATLEIRLPSSRFDEAISGLEPIGKLEAVNISAEDVGEEYVDVGARVANSHRLEERLIEVLATKTGKLSDVLQVERELARVREEIERMEGRLRYLRARTSVSTISITVHEPRPIVGERGSGNVIGAAFKQAWRNAVQFIARLIAALGTLIPAVILFGAAAFGVIRLWRRYRRTKKQEKKAE